MRVRIYFDKKGEWGQLEGRVWINPSASMNSFSFAHILKLAAVGGLLATIATVRWIKSHNIRNAGTAIEEQLPKSHDDDKNPDVNVKEPWRKWYGKVLGSENDIRNALEELGRSPKNDDELQDIIAERRSVEMPGSKGAKCG